MGKGKIARNIIWSKLKASADKIKVTKILKFVFGREETWWEEEKMLVTSIFTFSLNVFKRLLFQGRLKSLLSI